MCSCDYNPPRVFHHETPKANKPHGCEECGALIAKQRAAAEQCIALIVSQISNRIDRDAGLPSVELGYPADDHEAQSLGFPCVGAWQAMAARVISESPVPIKLIQR